MFPQQTILQPYVYDYEWDQIDSSYYPDERSIKSDISSSSLSFISKRSTWRFYDKNKNIQITKEERSRTICPFTKDTSNPFLFPFELEISFTVPITSPCVDVFVCSFGITE